MTTTKNNHGSIFLKKISGFFMVSACGRLILVNNCERCPFQEFHHDAGVLVMDFPEDAKFIIILISTIMFHTDRGFL
jgi:hypothetical protein